jgi:predicted nucleic acid-binding protein
VSEGETVFVDTNVFLRFLTNDDPGRADRARLLFQRAIDGELSLSTSLLVLAEIVWTLESFYRLDKKDIAAKVEAIVSTPNLECPDADLLLQALDFYATKNVDFIDAYHAHLLRSRGIGDIATYDRKHFGRVPWLQIIEP